VPGTVVVVNEEGERFETPYELLGPTQRSETGTP